MKKPEYTAGVVSIYRKYIDLYLQFGQKKYKVDNNDIKKLMTFLIEKDLVRVIIKHITVKK